jgi:membrane protein
LRIVSIPARQLTPAPARYSARGIATYGLNLLRTVWTRFNSDDCSDMAAQVSFYFVLSLFPFFLVVAAILGWIPTTSRWDSFAQWLSAYLPLRAQHTILTTMLDLSHGYGAFLSFGLIVTLWSASSGFLSLMEALSVAYGVEDDRGYVRKRAISIAATIVAAAFLILCFGVWNLGHLVATVVTHDFRYAVLFQAQWKIVRWLATLVVICLGVDLMIYFLPGSKRPWRWVTPGSVFAVIGFVASSFLLNLYVTHNSDIPKLYGALAGFIVIMLWMYIGCIILLIGAETDTAVQELRGNGAQA